MTNAQLVRQDGSGKKTFEQWMTDHQVAWRKTHVASKEWGRQNGKEYPWILPSALWEDGLWPSIRSGSANPLPEYLRRNVVQKHYGVHNLKSSWMHCANLYFPFGASAEGRALLATFLQRHVDSSVRSVDAVELEYAEEGAFSPSALLGEMEGIRGAGQTSPDLAFLVNGRRGLILAENKLLEHSFYDCSGRRTWDSSERLGNPDPERCNHPLAVAIDPKSQCHLYTWERKYWEHLAPIIDREILATLSWCPAAHGGYQLFRQQALAEGIAKSGKYDFVVSCLAVDARNEALADSLRRTGLSGLPDWARLFRGKAHFAVFTHQ